VKKICVYFQFSSNRFERMIERSLYLHFIDTFIIDEEIIINIICITFLAFFVFHNLFNSIMFHNLFQCCNFQAGMKRSPGENVHKTYADNFCAFTSDWHNLFFMILKNIVIFLTFMLSDRFQIYRFKPNVCAHKCNVNVNENNTHFTRKKFG